MWLTNSIGLNSVAWVTNAGLIIVTLVCFLSFSRSLILLQKK